MTRFGSPCDSRSPSDKDDDVTDHHVCNVASDWPYVHPGVFVYHDNYAQSYS